MALLPQYDPNQAQAPQDVQSPMSAPMPVGGSAAPEEPLVVGGDSPPVYTQETLDKRSSRFKYGLGDLLQKSQDEIYQNLQDGREPELRAQAASTIDERKQAATQKLITDVTANKQGELTPEEKTGLIGLVTQLNQKTDPNTVLESGYGKQFMATLDRATEDNPDNVLSDAQKTHPEAIAKLTNDHAELITKHQVIDTQIEDVEDILKHQGWLGYGYDIARGLIPGRADYTERGRVAGVGLFTGLGRGENIDEQRKVLMRLPTDDMAAELKRVIDPLKDSDPHLALDYLHSLKGMSSQEEFIQDWSLPVEFAGTGVGSAAAKLGVKSVKEGIRVIKGAGDLGKLADAKVAIEDITKAAALPTASKSTVEAAAGDLKESAITRATTNAVADVKNLPDATKRGVEALSETHRADMVNVRTNPGQYGQDMANRIEERGNQMMTNVLDTAINIQKNERLPEVLANESAVRLIVEDMKDKYVGLKNSIVNTSKIYKEPLSNTYQMDFLLGNPDGTAFSQRSVAENFIKYHRLGEADLPEVSGPSPNRTPEFDKNIAAAQKIVEKETPRTINPKFTDDTRAKAQAKVSEAHAYIADQRAKQAAGQTATVEQQGLGYFVKITKGVDETRPAIRDAIARTGNTKIPESPVAFFLNNWLGKSIGAYAAKLRTPEEVLSPVERANRLTSTYAPTVYFKLMAEEGSKEIRALKARYDLAGSRSEGGKRWTEWMRGLTNAQELPDALDPTRKGYFFKDPVEMETYWQQWFHHLPDEQQVAAYFEFKRGMEVDRMFRNIHEQTLRTRVGAESHKIILQDAAGKEMKSAAFDGVQLHKVPGGKGRIAIFTDKAGQETTPELSRASAAKKADIQKDMDSGNFKLIEVYNPKQRPLSGFSTITDERIRWALVPNVETKPLDWNHVPRRGGGHIQYDHDFNVKQAIVTRDDVAGSHIYEGDTSIAGVQNEGIGRNFAKHLDQVRQHLKNKDEAAAKAYSEKELHVDWSKVRSWFVGGKDAEGKFQPPRLNMNETIQVVPKGRTTIQHDNNLRFKYSNFQDGTREGSLAAQNQVAFTQERDAFDFQEINVSGTRAKPLYDVSPAATIDPITTMNRGFAGISRSNFMDDYKTMAVEHWLQEAKQWIDVKTESQLFHSPYHYYNEGKFLPNTPPEVRLRLEAARYHTQQFVGQPSVTDALLASISQKLADSAFGTFGPKGLVITPTKSLTFLKDPIAKLKAIAFDLKLGLGNIPQLVVQMGNYSNILGIAGYKAAAPGTMAAQLHFWSRVSQDSKFIDHLDSIASKFWLPGTHTFKPGQFKEAMEELHWTGFGNVDGGSHVLLDDPMNSKIFKTATDSFLDWGRYPFKAGDQNAKYGAWYTSYLEFRDKNPFGRITNEDRASILQRADLLNVNMSRASASMLHKGFLAPASQFYTYQLRLGELVFGSRLTGVERARMFLTNAALYGIPMATGMTGLPIADYLRQKAIEHSYVVGDDYLKSLLMEGIPSAIGALITGKGDPQAGTWYDVGPRFGTKGFEFLGQATNPDKGFLDMAGGPVYSIAKETFKASDGLMYALGSMMRGDGEVFPMVAEDVADVAKEISSFKAAYGVYAAMNYGRYVSKTDAYIADSSTGQALFTALFGVKDVAIDDVQIMNNSIRAQADYEKQVETQFRQEFDRGVLAQKDNPELAKRFFTRAQAWLAVSGYREDRIASVVNKARNDNQSRMEKVDWDFYIRKRPDAQSQTRYDAMGKKLRIQDKKQGNE